MSLLRSKYDDQTDYEDPVDRYQRRGKGARTTKGETCSTASTANLLGILAMVPVLGVVCTPLCWLLTSVAHKQLNANPKLDGRHLARNAFLFSMIGLLVNYLTPILFVLLLRSR